MQKIKVRVYVNLRESILDPQGKAVEKGLRKLGFDDVEGVRIGKMIELIFPAETDMNSLGEKVKRMCGMLLVNEVMEDYRFEIVREDEAVI